MRWLAAAVFVTVCSAGVAQMPVANSKIAPTSTMCACPASSKCDSLSVTISAFQQKSTAPRSQ